MGKQDPNISNKYLIHFLETKAAAAEEKFQRSSAENFRLIASRLKEYDDQEEHEFNSRVRGMISALRACIGDCQPTQTDRDAANLIEELMEKIEDLKLIISKQEEKQTRSIYNE